MNRSNGNVTDAKAYAVSELQGTERKTEAPGERIKYKCEDITGLTSPFECVRFSGSPLATRQPAHSVSSLKPLRRKPIKRTSRGIGSEAVQRASQDHQGPLFGGKGRGRLPGKRSPEVVAVRVLRGRARVLGSLTPVRIQSR
ncbi:hypothetical protein SKAU_G00110560 [Synaphobranchus kaupii]|uniref:Uncharacterized protein n=1 Tax=Synaphobranchus kaupii TaxID=118154 RepID=A0A9Q1J8E9_SYNKA|nr:hypothetical protein SKAU_G00110560 [Synaphobranchus kaupii]